MTKKPPDDFNPLDGNTEMGRARLARMDRRIDEKIAKARREAPHLFPPDKWPQGRRPK